MQKLARRRRVSGQRRRQILDAALACFLEQGFEATTIEQIRTASGASHGSIYHHFGSKQAIAVALYLDGMHAHQAEILQGLRAHATAKQGIKAFVAGHLQWMTDNPNWALYLMRVSLAEVSGEAAEQIAAINQQFFRTVHEWLKPFIDKGEVVCVHPSLYVPLIIGPAAHYARHWLSGRLALDLNEMADVFASAAWRSLRDPRGERTPATRRNR